MTATPAPETLAFFNNNRIVNYTLEKSIADGVNVDYRVYRIKTQATEDGGAIREGGESKKITRYTGTVEDIKTREESTYTKTELNRSIINPAQIKSWFLKPIGMQYIRNVRRSTARTEYGLSLAENAHFALNDAHASNIVKIAKRDFRSER